jgi:hypothetical protein
LNDREAAQQIKRLKRIQQKWVSCLGLDWWTMEFVYSRDPLRDVGPAGFRNDTRAVASTSSDWRYRDATMTFDLALCSTLPDDQLESVFLHEAMHVHLNEIRDGEITVEQRDREERVATTMAIVLGWVRDSGKKEARISNAQAKARKR